MGENKMRGSRFCFFAWSAAERATIIFIFYLKKRGAGLSALRPVQMGNCWVAISALQAGGCNALDEVLLQGQEYDQDRDQCDNGSRHDQAILGRVLADEHF